MIQMIDMAYYTDFCVINEVFVILKSHILPDIAPPSFAGCLEDPDSEFFHNGLPATFIKNRKQLSDSPIFTAGCKYFSLIVKNNGTCRRMFMADKDHLFYSLHKETDKRQA